LFISSITADYSNPEAAVPSYLQAVLPNPEVQAAVVLLL
jgi:hypothetical protein